MDISLAESITSDVAIRLLPEFNTLRVQCGDRNKDIPTEEWWLPNMAVIFAHEEAEVFGWCALMPDEKEKKSVIYSIWTKPHANQGDTEDKLVRKALSLAKRKRSTELSVGVYADTDAVPSPYNRLGFEVGYIGLAMPL